MALDPSIILGYKSPDIMSGQERQGNALKLQQLIMGNQEAQMKMDATKQAMATAQKYRDFISQNPKANGEQLRAQGFVDEGYAADKFSTEQAKTQAEINDKQFKTSQEKFTFHAQGLKAVAESPDPINAANQFIQQSVMFGTMAPEIAQQLTAQMQGKTPEQIKQASMAMFQQALSAKEQMDLRDMKNVDNGGTNQVIMTDKLAGTVTPVYSTNKTQTPDSIANNQRMTQEGALNRGVTMRGQDITARGQNMTDARARASAAASGAKTSPAGKVTEGMRSAGEYAARMEAAETLLKKTTEQAPSIKEKITGFINEDLANGVRSNDRQKALQAQRDWVRAKLRKESGAAIGVDEMKNEIITYFPQINDGPDVIEQKMLARKQAIEGLKNSAGSGYVAPKTNKEQIIPEGKDAGTINKPTVSNW